MKISENGLSLIKKFEGCVLQVYLDCVKVKTVGYGHTGADVNGLPVGARISQAQADALLLNDVAKFEKNVNKYDSIYHWSQHEFDALCSFAFNLGTIDKLVNKGKRTKMEIADKMLLYNKAGGKVISGLTNRRQKEQALFLSSDVAGDDVSAITERTYLIGNTYTLQTNLYIRKEPYGSALKYDMITANAKQHSHFDSTGHAILNKLTRVTCKGVRKEFENSTWIKIPSGWICAREGHEVYII